MTDTTQALVQHRAKLREDVIKLPFTDNQNVFDGETVIKRADVLKILNRD